MVARLIEEARATVPDVRVEEVDVTEHPETAVKYRVMATPAIAINGRLEFCGGSRRGGAARAPSERAVRVGMVVAAVVARQRSEITPSWCASPAER